MTRLNYISILIVSVLLIGCDSDPFHPSGAFSGSGSPSIETNLSFSAEDGMKGYRSDGTLSCLSSGQSVLTRAQLFIEGRPGAALDTTLTGRSWSYQFDISVYSPILLTFTCWAESGLSETKSLQLKVAGSEHGSPLPRLDYAYFTDESDQISLAPEVLVSFIGGPYDSPIVPRLVVGIGIFGAEDIPSYTEKVVARPSGSDAYFDRGHFMSWRDAQRESINQIFFSKEDCLTNLPPERRTLELCVQATRELLFESHVSSDEFVGYRKRYADSGLMLVTRFHDSGAPIDQQWISLVLEVVGNLNANGMGLAVHEYEQAPASSLYRESWGMYHTNNGGEILVLPVDGQSEEWLATHYEFHPPFYSINASSFQIGSPSVSKREQAMVDLLRVILGTSESPTLRSFPVEYQILFLQNWISLLRKHDFEVWGIDRGDQIENVLGFG